MVFLSPKTELLTTMHEIRNWGTIESQMPPSQAQSLLLNHYEINYTIVYNIVNKRGRSSKLGIKVLSAGEWCRIR